MVSINISSGQGITQAIATKLGLKGQDLKQISLSTWQNVMAEVNNAQSQIDKHNNSNPSDKQKSIFTGSRDVNALNQKSAWQTNFVVQQGSVEINEGAWAKIVQLLTGKTEKLETKAMQAAPLNSEQTEVSIPQKIEYSESVQKSINDNILDVVDAKVLERSVNGEKQKIAIVDIEGQKHRRTINEDGSLGDSLAATKTIGKNKYISGDFPPETKILEREVNGDKSPIGIYEDENGNKVRKLVITDEETGKTTLGENLVTVSTMGKNKYVTESKFNADVKSMLGLGLEEEIPSELKPEYINIGGQSQLVIKKDGKVMDSSQIKEFMKNHIVSKQNQNIKNYQAQGYVLSSLVVDGNDTAVYQKDGKTYSVDPQTYNLAKEIGFTYINEFDGSKSEYIYTDNNSGQRLVRTISPDGYIREYIDENNQLFKDENGEIQFKLENGQYYKYDKGNYILISGDPFE